MSPRKPQPRRVKAEIRIDPEAWALVYGLDPTDLVAIQEDAQSWAHNLLTEAARENGVLADD